MNWKMLRQEARNTGDFFWIMFLHSPNKGDIHYNVYIPDSYDGTKKYALYVTLPGYQGLYFGGGRKYPDRRIRQLS